MMCAIEILPDQMSNDKMSNLLTQYQHSIGRGTLCTVEVWQMRIGKLACQDGNRKIGVSGKS